MGGKKKKKTKKKDSHLEQRSSILSHIHSIQVKDNANNNNNNNNSHHQNANIYNFSQDLREKAPEQILDIANKLLQSDTTNHISESADLSGILNNAGVLHQTQNNFKKAAECYQRAVELEALKSGPTSPKLSDILNNLGHLNLKLGDPKVAVSYFERCFEVDKIHCGVDSIQVAECLNNLGVAHKELSHWAKAQKYLETSFGLFKELKGAISKPVGDSLKNLGNLHRAQNNFAKARKYFLAALDVYRQTDGEESLPVATVQLHLGQICHMQDKLSESIEFLLLSFATLTSKLAPSQSGLLTVVTRELGEVYLLLGDEKSAIFYMERLLKVLREQDRREEVSSLLTHLSSLYLRNGHLQKAVSASSSSLFQLNKRQ